MSVPIGTKAKSDSQYEMRGNKSSKKKESKKEKRKPYIFQVTAFRFQQKQTKKKN